MSRIQRVACAATAVAAIAVGVAACGGGGAKDTARTTSPSTTAATVAATQTTTTDTTPPAAPVKLSEKWGPKLDTLADKGVQACKADAGSSTCVSSLTDDLNAYSGILNDVSAGDPEQYQKTVTELNKVIPSATAYSSARCQGNPSARSKNSQCFKDATTVTVGLIAVKTFLQVDEISAGAS